MIPALLVFMALLGGATPPAHIDAPPATAAATPAPSVAVSIAPQRWLVERLLGDRVTVVTVIEPGMSHETYQPTDRQATLVMQSLIYFEIGLPLERGRWFDAIRRSNVTLVDCRAGIETRVLEGHSHDQDDQDDHDGHGKHDPGHGDPGHVCTLDGQDPHIWTSPALLKKQARTMAAALRTRFPAWTNEIDLRLPTLERELDSLDAELRRTLEPARGKALMVFHPAWGYFADAYGLRQIAIEQEGKTPTDRELTELQRLARREAVKVIFVQPQISSKAADAVAATVGARVEAIDPLGADVPANLRAVAKAIAESLR